MGRRITDFSAKPVYQYFVYDAKGNYLYLSYSFTNKADDMYNTLVDLQKGCRVSFSNYIQSLPSAEKKEALSSPLPPMLSWVVGSVSILPQNSYSNNGNIRKINLKKRLNDKSPLFVDEFYERELKERDNYFTGKDDCDKMKSDARDKYTNEYWDAYMLACCNWVCSAV